MSTQILITKLTDRPVATCLLGMPSAATGLMSSVLPAAAPAARLRSERPTEASAVAAAQAKAYAFGSAAAAAGAGTRTVIGAAGAHGFGNGQQKTQQYGKWAFRGLEPWSDPA
ncbi:hypothetical protein [Streptomyces sp. NPDC021020]|uniref:hypothetical protein n=1 Tax=Streptomyces sp. NPDC021020 TaxID=3365109 RepID=UPI00379D72B1